MRDSLFYILAESGSCCSPFKVDSSSEEAVEDLDYWRLIGYDLVVTYRVSENIHEEVGALCESFFSGEIPFESLDSMIENLQQVSY